MPIVPQAKPSPDGIRRETITEFSFASPFPGWELPSFAEDEGHCIHFRYISHRHDPDRVSLCIEIDDDTTIDDLRACWSLVKERRERLQEHQGLWPYGDNDFSHLLLTLKRDYGMSWAEVAERVNRAIADHLAEAANGDDFKQRFALYHADDLLRLARPGMTDDERHELLTEELQEIKHKEFYPDWPVTGDDIRARLRQWKDNTGEGW